MPLKNTGPLASPYGEYFIIWLLVLLSSRVQAGVISSDAEIVKHNTEREKIKITVMIIFFSRIQYSCCAY
jgi:hypothetical protein